MPRFTQLEFHRDGVGLVPGAVPEPAGTAIAVLQSPERPREIEICTCKEGQRKGACPHLAALGKALAELRHATPDLDWRARFEASPWLRLARILHQGEGLACSEARIRQVDRRGVPVLRIAHPHGRLLALYVDPSPARIRFLERTSKAPQGYEARDRLLRHLALFQTTAEERTFNKKGLQTQRQRFEESFWHRLAYHAVREFGLETGRFEPAVDLESGAFTLTFLDDEGEERVRLVVPPTRVAAALAWLGELDLDSGGRKISPIPLRSLLLANESTALIPRSADAAAAAVPELHAEEESEARETLADLRQLGEAYLRSRPGAIRSRYGDLLYLPELEILCELERPGSKRNFRPPARLPLHRCRVEAFREPELTDLDAGGLILDEPLQDLRIFRSYDTVRISPQMLERSWYWLSVDYGFGNQSVSLEEILRARADGLPYLETGGGWVDLNAAPIRDLGDGLRLEAEEGMGDAGGEGHGEGLRVSASDLLQLQAQSQRPLEVAGDGDGATRLRQLLDLQPPAPYRAPEGLKSRLRPYQEIGVDWLRFLWTNQLGGLLCDDMGLGKTHQAMALMLCLREQDGVEGPFLVACPTSVISHWLSKVKQYAPALKPRAYHGAERDLGYDLRRAGLLITSYGVLRRDARRLAGQSFAAAFFDEIQHLKNPETRGYRAAARLDADLKIGLTGTPIENSLGDLKALLDLVMPGYLGDSESFGERYPDSADSHLQQAGLADLRRRIAPFTLRRLKATVLDELPEKIEDLRTCDLSEDQVKLYRDAIAERGAELAEQLADESVPLPYIHVFAVLNLLKQICDHPALALGELDRAQDYRSGKWDLFLELMDEALSSGQKVVVFSQYLGMLSLMERQMARDGVGCVTLTGSSRDRGPLIERFNTDPACRVFLGSLKAGGTGIDLVGGSVVIHYDRWWNAAREDQATDRVYRIGQKKAVQVFKLVTTGTLEEKIAALIERKRRLMESVVEEDDPQLRKVFSREEILDLLQPPRLV